MPFPRRLLSEGEQLVLDVRPHWIALLGPVAVTIVIVAAAVAGLVYVPDTWPAWVRWAIVAAAVVAFLAWPAREIVAWVTSHFVVTSDRLIHRSGWFAKRSMEIPLEKISDVRFNQSVFERLIGAGDLTIESPGEFGQETFDNVRRPEDVQKLIYEMGEENQRRMSTPGTTPSVAGELERLDRLRQEGVLTDQEFQAQKLRLLRS
ncbi:MAG: PH domain-containing protein [Actinomycetota bacterium]